MENYDDDVLGVNNPEHPANQNESKKYEPTDLTEALEQYEEYQDKKSLQILEELIEESERDAKKFRKAFNKAEQYCAWKKIQRELQVKALYYPNLENETAYQNAIDMVKKLKKQLFKILK